MPQNNAYLISRDILDLLFKLYKLSVNYNVSDPTVDLSSEIISLYSEIYIKILNSYFTLQSKLKYDSSILNNKIIMYQNIKQFANFTIMMIGAATFILLILSWPINDGLITVFLAVDFVAVIIILVTSKLIKYEIDKSIMQNEYIEKVKSILKIK